MCHKLFDGPSDLANHLLTSHEPMKKIQCNFCASTFTTKSNLKTHYVAKHRLNKSQLNDALSNLNIVDVIETNDLKPEYECEVCQKTFKRAENLRVHRKKHNPDRQKILCPDCKTPFVDISSFRRHFRRLHSTEPEKLVMAIKQIHATLLMSEVDGIQEVESSNNTQPNAFVTSIVPANYAKPVSTGNSLVYVEQIEGLLSTNVSIKFEITDELRKFSQILLHQPQIRLHFLLPQKEIIHNISLIITSQLNR